MASASHPAVPTVPVAKGDFVTNSLSARLQMFVYDPENGCTFELDLAETDLQLEVDDVSKQLLTINTHRGLYHFNRLPFGVKPAPGIFQQCMDALIAGLDGTAAYLDDILVTGKTIGENNVRLDAVLKRIQDYGFRVRLDKCAFLQTKFTYLGIKAILSSDLLLTHFDSSLPIIVAADAPNYGMGATLSHRFADGCEKVIYHASLCLTQPQKDYSQIEKEALALIFAVQKFHLHPWTTFHAED
ncbi:hypothetical protein RB195_004452 [Necator americanus]|uniref:Reverse transcriptase domain-containing protein n=1 Tax=Necator americanus TaxID=51031 RepID=A0ABR1BI20_NECAM